MAATPIGERLKSAREAKGLSLDDIAGQTRIPIRHLKHIEEGRWEELPAVTYSVGFARTYANTVGLNGNEVGAELREQLGATRAEPAQAVYYEPADPARVPPRSIAWIFGALAVLLIAGYLVWRSGAVDGTAVDEGALAGAETTAPAPQTQEPASQAPATVTASGPVVLTASEEVWLRVYEAGGSRLYEATMQAGDRYEVPATATRPQILTGKPQALRVTVGGTEVAPLGEPERTISDVSLLASDLVAREQPSATAPTVGAGSSAGAQGL